ncbi:MAG: Uroporphyrinogen-III C-methyltransferase [Syntrophaceae bacterium PtaU1.Bin231]|nr:MAG: Uroporphyrinogen-III C-methyltransferase [Syntrophaceae bacterium PtaU1.Bin231]
MKKGKVYIVGAGPGDAGLITLKGVRCLERADVVIYDHLVNPEILRHAHAEAQFVYAGKQGGDHTLSQDEINARLVAEAAAGKIVTRLKGGDPLIFGRGGEEAEVLSNAGIDFEIVPGVTSAIAVPAYAGISLTQRGYTSTLAFVTGHEDPNKEGSDIDWRSLAGIGTLVFLMGVKNLPSIAAELIAHGKAAETPAALIRWGTTPDQRTVTAPLSGIADAAERAAIEPPAILVVGDVVSLRERLNWFERLPLFGKGIVVTRPEDQAEGLRALLAAQGARVIFFPTIRVEPPAGWGPVDDAIGRIGAYGWIVFTSANGVDFFLKRLKEKGRDLRDLKNIRIATIGPATAAKLRALGLRVDLVPERYLSEGVVEAFAALDMAGKCVLLPRAEEARDVIPEGLRRMGAAVDVVTVYRTVSSDRDPAEILGPLREGRIDVLTFTSPSTLTNFLRLMGNDFALPAGVKIACIGPITAAAVRKAGLPVDIVEERYTVEGLVEAIVRHFAGGGAA